MAHTQADESMEMNVEPNVARPLVPSETRFQGGLGYGSPSCELKGLGLAHSNQ